jgi:hypothetical protein
MFETETQTAEYPQAEYRRPRRRWRRPRWEDHDDEGQGGYGLGEMYSAGEAGYPRGEYPMGQWEQGQWELPPFGKPPTPSPDLILDDFDFGRADLKQSHKNKIDQLAQQIVDSWKPASTRPALGVRVVGHTDKVGPIEYNLDLGTRRAEKVMGRLTGLIVGGDIGVYQRMTWSRTSVGKAQPRSLSVPAQNRRVEIFVEWGRVKPSPAPPPPRDPQCAAACNAAQRRCLAQTRFPPACLMAWADCNRNCR